MVKVVRDSSCDAPCRAIARSSYVPGAKPSAGNVATHVIRPCSSGLSSVGDDRPTMVRSLRELDGQVRRVGDPLVGIEDDEGGDLGVGGLRDRRRQAGRDAHRAVPERILDRVGLVAGLVHALHHRHRADVDARRLGEHADRQLPHADLVGLLVAHDACVSV